MKAVVAKAAPVEKLSIDQPLERVFAVLEERSRTCLDVEVPHIANVGYGFRAFSPNSEILIADNSVLETRTGKLIARLDGSIHNIVFSPDGKRFACNLSAGSPAIYETATGNPLRQ